VTDGAAPDRRPVLLLLAGLGLFITALDAYVVVTLLPAMVADVGLTIDRFEQATPIVTGFLGGYVVAMPLLGAYSDVRGRAPVYAACMFVFAVGSAITATAGLWSFAGLPWLVAGRFLQGLGGGGLVPLSLALAADLYRNQHRMLALGSVAAMQEAGSVFGPIYGAWLAGILGGWRGVFWLNLPLGAGILAGLWYVQRRPHLGGAASATEPGTRIDWIGAGLLGLGLGLLVLALYPDDPSRRPVNALALPAGLAAALVLGLFVWSQRRLAPLVAAGLVHSRVFWTSMGANLLAGVALVVALVDVPLLARAAFGLDRPGSRGHP